MSMDLGRKVVSLRELLPIATLAVGLVVWAVRAETRAMSAEGRANEAHARIEALGRRIEALASLESRSAVIETRLNREERALSDLREDMMKRLDRIEQKLDHAIDPRRRPR